MPLSRSRDYLSIGEVLEELRKDFPDVSISKIRFLEAEGLISPERTGSGYRKFYEPDVTRLRHVLTLQRDHFMPLKVIREKLPEIEANGGSLPPAAAPAASPDQGSVPAPAPTGVQMDREELRRSAGLDEQQLAGLEDFGIIERKEGSSYDENDLIAARAARRFLDFGVEPRHLRMYKQFAERELAFFEQIVSPIARRRDPAAAGEASTTVRELAGLSRQLAEAALRSRLGAIL